MQKCICDLCKENDASRMFKVKKLQKKFIGNVPTPNQRFGDTWGNWEDIDICSECAEKLLGLTEGNGK